MKKEHLRDEIIIPTLKHLNMYSESAVNLLLGTAAQESHLGYFLKQIKGPALGIYQIEPATLHDIYSNWLTYKKEISGKLTELGVIKLSAESNLIGNLYYATAMARIHYYRVPEALPDADDIECLARYWKQHYNTPQGRGTEEEFIHNYKKYVIGR